jgi:hypothetical protein
VVKVLGSFVRGPLEPHIGGAHQRHALWLGHVSVDTTQIYLHADLNLRKRHSPERDHPTAAPADAAHPTA